MPPQPHAEERTSATVRRRRAPPPPPPSIHVDLPDSQPFARLTSPAGPPTPRSTLGSPLTSHAHKLRSGVGDLAAGPRRKISLSEVELLPWMCCMTPALCLFSHYIAIFVTFLWFTKCFYLIVAFLSFICMLWVFNLACSSLVGAFRLRMGGQTDWHVKVQELPEEEVAGVMHIVLLPNYCENERMLKETLENLGKSRMAASTLRVVLAMEAREGPAAREKADRLIQQTSHLFVDIFATYHPAGVPGEVAGKSSNTQWAFREALRKYGYMLTQFDLSKVFLTVGDADTLWHPQYLSALTYQGLTIGAEERSWTIWQPPVLLLRNIFSVPSITRSSAHATLIFELSSLANQTIFPAFAYSAYSMTLALASHPEVDGWDVDVIAEDHHMFCKCYFASVWELAHAATDTSTTPKAVRNEDINIVPKVRVEPVYLPAVSYLAESSEGYVASLWARFQQARRHSQGVIELGYVMLQYVRLVKAVGIGRLPFKTHAMIWAIIVKMHMLHISTTAQCSALILCTLSTVLPNVMRWLREDLQQVLQAGIVSYATNMWGGLDGAQQYLISLVGQMSGLMLVYSVVCYLVLGDLLEGRYHQNAESAAPETPTHEMPPLTEEEAERTPQVGSRPPSPQKVAERDTSAATTAAPPSSASPPSSSSVTPTPSPKAEATPSSATNQVTPSRQGRSVSATPSHGCQSPPIPKGAMVWFFRASLCLSIFIDTIAGGYTTIFILAVIPELLAGWSLVRKGADFEYIVALKPEEYG